MISLLYLLFSLTVISDAFLYEPKDLEVDVEGEAKLACEPPRGYPRPTVRSSINFYFCLPCWYLKLTTETILISKTINSKQTNMSDK